MQFSIFNSKYFMDSRNINSSVLKAIIFLQSLIKMFGISTIVVTESLTEREFFYLQRISLR
ncbi:hypothetical protein QFZ20_001414 [Flavobacterium sp. W4I14]|nr:hypothetical protein [Flavobacterium sp. W4I14]